MNRKRHLFILCCFFLLCSMVYFMPAKASAARAPVRLNVQQLSIAKDSKYTLRIYNAKKNYKIYFSTTNKNVVALPSKKPKARKIKFTAKNIGSTIINVKIKVKKRTVAKLTCAVEVTPPAISVKFARRKVKLFTGETRMLRLIIKPNTSAVQPVFESSNPEIVQVNARGRITAIAPGEAWIKTTLSTGQTATCKITITDADSSSDVPVEPKEYVKLKTLAQPGNGL